MSHSPKHQLTPSQDTAIYDHKRNLIVVAGAGSGKTFVLVERYLALLDRHPEWPLNAIVAITFTKKAAQEMRDRVRQALEQRFTDAPVDEQTIWAGRISAMDSARIDTIHGLCVSILRANAADAGIDPGFEVLDEVQAQILLDDCIHNLLQSVASTEGTATPLFNQYDVRIIQQTLVRLAPEDIPTLPTDPTTEWQQDWISNAAKHIAALREDPQYVAASTWQPSTGWPTDADKLNDMWSVCHSLTASFDSSDDTLVCLDILAQLGEQISWTSGSAAVWGGKEILAEAKASLKSLREVVRDVLAAIGDPPGAIDANTTALLPLWKELIDQLQELYWTRKQAEGVLDFNDLERLTCNLLVHSATVRERYQGAEFKHLLVDEFQDTNARQWEIIQGLARIDEDGSLFVVGDPKQSIYQFRGADISVFDRVAAQITEAGGAKITLAQSFRSHETLVNGFNHVFQHLLTRDRRDPVSAYEVEYGDIMQATRVQAPSDAPPIEITFIDKSLSKEKIDTETARRWEAYEIAKRLTEIVVDEKRPIYDKRQQVTRPIGYGDIAVLFQSMSNIALYEEVFKTAELPFVTVAGRGFYNRQEVWDVLNLLTAIHNPGDDLALASALRSPLFGLSDDTLLALRLQRDSSDPHKRLPLYQALFNPIDIAGQEQTRIDFARQCLGKLRSLAGRVSIAHLMETALDETGYLATLTGLPDGTRRRGNVEKLLDKAQESRQVTLGAFSQYLRDLSNREVREGEALIELQNSITLMTVHASKGLEYPLVALADIGWSRGNNSVDAVILDPAYGLLCKTYDATTEKLVGGYAYQKAERLQLLRDIAERKRLLYVAATRAQDYLLLSGQTTRNAKDTWFNWIIEAFDLGDIANGSTITIEYAWGNLDIRVPEYVAIDTFAGTKAKADTASLWSQPDALSTLTGDAHVPILADVPFEARASIRHLTATQIGDAGGAYLNAIYRQRFRHSILRSAPLTVDHVSSRKGQDVSQRIIGDMVHKVLGWWQFQADQEHVDERLDSYAWELGVVDEGQRKYAVQEAHKLIGKMRNSPVFEWLQSAKQVYRELPFVYRTDKRIIHGVLDVLFQRLDGSWVILDYKTSHVMNYTPNGDENLLRLHAVRYHLQLGVYGAAVKEQLNGIVPETYIYYIRYGKYVEVSKKEWSEALGKLEATIGDLLTERVE